MAGTLLAFMLITPKTFEVQEYPLPVIHPDEGLLRVEVTGICGKLQLGAEAAAGGLPSGLSLAPGADPGRRLLARGVT
ncbi:MAG: hypothetical protein ACREOH_12190 [Candidatus Entotheonellia bacterium]